MKTSHCNENMRWNCSIEMVLIRRFEENVRRTLHARPRSAGFFISALEKRPSQQRRIPTLPSNPDDAIVATYREHGHALARGISPRSIMAEMFGKVKGCSRGRGGSMHLFDMPRLASSVGTRLSVAARPNRRRA